MIQKCLIANRGEIAVRIIRACKDMGIKTVAIYSTADKNALHVLLADESVCVGEANSKDSYLNVNNILSAALSLGVDAIHPGFGFLAENASFARLVIACGLIFIGPHPDVIDLMGNKINARNTMFKAGVPIIPGSLEPIKNMEEGLLQAQTIGYPIILKAAAGGGGKGIRMIEDDESFLQAFNVLRQEAKNYFNDDSLCQAAVTAAKAVKYDSVGTIEFLMDEESKFYFMEMNTRIQVEHPVTEMITGVDIVKHMIRSADKQKLSIKQKDVKINGHAIECRIISEDYRNDFKPSVGRISFYHAPGGKDVRIDSALYSGYDIPPFYDSMMAKLITSGSTRLNAIKRMRSALEEFIVEGVENNLEFCYLTMFNSNFVTGRYTTQFANDWIKELKERESTL